VVHPAKILPPSEGHVDLYSKMQHPTLAQEQDSVTSIANRLSKPRWLLQPGNTALNSAALFRPWLTMVAQWQEACPAGVHTPLLHNRLCFQHCQDHTSHHDTTS
jgi:hypothetical protein